MTFKEKLGRQMTKEAGGKCKYLPSFLRVRGNLADRSGPWPAASITNAMKAVCKQPVQMVFEACAVVRSKLQPGAYSFAGPSKGSSAKALADFQLELIAGCGRSLRGR